MDCQILKVYFYFLGMGGGHQFPWNHAWKHLGGDIIHHPHTDFCVTDILCVYSAARPITHGFVSAYKEISQVQSGGPISGKAAFKVT